MEDKIKKDWFILKGVIQHFEEQNKNPCHPYLTTEEREIFEKKIQRAIREKKLKRILK